MLAFLNRWKISFVAEPKMVASVEDSSAFGRDELASLDKSAASVKGCVRSTVMAAARPNV